MGLIREPEGERGSAGKADSFSPPPDPGPSRRPAPWHHPKASHRRGPGSQHPGQGPAGAGRMRTGPPRRTPWNPPRPAASQAAAGPAPPHAGARPRNPAAAAAPPPGPRRGHHLAPGLRDRTSRRLASAARFGNGSSNRGAAGVLGTSFSLSSPPSWFQRQAAPAEPPSASMEAARRSECRGNRSPTPPPIFCLLLVLLACLITSLPHNNKMNKLKINKGGG